MNREQGAFLLGGIVFGLVTGLLLGFVFFKPGVLAVPPASPSIAGSLAGTPGSLPEGEGSPGPAPSTGGMDPGMAAGPAGMAAMGKVLQEISRLKEAIAKDPKNFEALMQLGELYTSAGKYEQSRQYYQQAVEVNPHDAEAWTSLGLCLLNLRQPKEALEKCREAMRHDPKFWPAAAYSVVAALELGVAASAEQSLGQLRALNPSFEHLKEFEDRVGRMKAGHGALAGS